MGHKVHPVSVRIKVVENRPFFKGAEENLLLVGNAFYSFYSHAFKSKSLIGEKLGKAVKAEKLFFSLFSKLSIFVNNFFLWETQSSLLIIIEYFSSSANISLFKKQLFVYKCHVESVFFDKRPVKLFVISLAKKLKEQHIKTSIAQFKRDWLSNSQGSFLFKTVGLISNFWPCSQLFAAVVSFIFKKTLEHQRLLDFLDHLFFFLFNFRFSQFKGLRLEVRGRLNASDRSVKRIVFHGVLPLQVLSQMFLSYSFSSATTSYGVVGIRVFFSYKGFF